MVSSEKNGVYTCKQCAVQVTRKRVHNSTNFRFLPQKNEAYFLFFPVQLKHLIFRNKIQPGIGLSPVKRRKKIVPGAGAG